MPAPAYRFGGFRFDAGRGTLTRASAPVDLPERHRVVLAHLLAASGETVSKDALIAAAWDVAVTDNSLEQVISALRRILGAADGGRPWIETVPRRGYRFAGDVVREALRETDEALDALLAPHRAFIEGRAALEALDAGRLQDAHTAFERALHTAPDEPAAHLGLANACLMRFETTRADAAPQTRLLADALRHAREACRLDPRSGEAWATLGLALDRSGMPVDGLAAVRRAAALEPDNWRHHFRQASVAWGEERLRASRRTLDLLPDFPLAHWMAASVLVARGALAEAARALDEGLAAVAVGSDNRPPAFSAIALHWLRGLIHLRHDDFEAAESAFRAELSGGDVRHLYAREAGANTWYALAALRRRQRRDDEATSALRRALSLVPDHPLASAMAGGPASTPHGEAIQRQLAGDTGAAAALIVQALDAAPAGNLLWMLPVEPVLAVHDSPEAWAAALARLRARAA